ncbi:MAG: helix-turn-helix transcriptional regulator [Candidatus Brocadiae bacterium]|nr:helix-turn-helix transcriptional regulator [Candidatus Brocadiia bacterium]
MNQIKDIIRVGRARKSLSQTDLAQKIGVVASAVSQWEAGKKIPSGDILIKLAKELDIVDELFPDRKKERRNGNSIESRIDTIESFIQEIGKKLNMPGINISQTNNRQANGIVVKG